MPFGDRSGYPGSIFPDVLSFGFWFGDETSQSQRSTPTPPQNPVG